MSAIPLYAQSTVYFGGRIGAITEDDTEARVGVFEDTDLFNATGSAFAGYRHRTGNMTIGTEVESSFLPAADAPSCAISAGRCGIEVSRFGSLRAVVGLDSDNGHFYAHAGLALADVNASLVGGSGDASDILTGWTAGIGMQREVGESGWFVNGDVSFYRFEDASFSIGPGLSASAQPEFLAARVGLGLSF